MLGCRSRNAGSVEHGSILQSFPSGTVRDPLWTTSGSRLSPWNSANHPPTHRHDHAIPLRTGLPVRGHRRRTGVHACSACGGHGAVAGVRHCLADQPGGRLASGPVGAPAGRPAWAFGLRCLAPSPRSWSSCCWRCWGRRPGALNLRGCRGRCAGQGSALHKASQARTRRAEHRHIGRRPLLHIVTCAGCHRSPGRSACCRDRSLPRPVFHPPSP